MSIKPSINQKNRIHRDDKWEAYERHKKKLSCKYSSDLEKNPGRYERAIKLLCRIMKL